MHSFTVRSTTDAVDRLVALGDPEGSAAADGPGVRLDPTRLAAGDAGPATAAIDAATRTTRLLLLRSDGGPGHGRMTSTYASSNALWLVEVAGPGHRDGIRARPVSRATLGEAIAGLLADLQTVATKVPTGQNS